MTPGGIGTFEEFFEILTLRQLGRHTKPIAILNTLHYFDPLLQLLETAIEQRFMQSSNRSLYRVCDDPSEALDALASAQPQTGTVEEYKFF